MILSLHNRKVLDDLFIIIVLRPALAAAIAAQVIGGVGQAQGAKSAFDETEEAPRVAHHAAFASHQTRSSPSRTSSTRSVCSVSPFGRR